MGDEPFYPSRGEGGSRDKKPKPNPFVGGRLPPHNLEAERSILGAILLNNESIHRVIESGVEPRDFYKEAHQRIFEVLIALSEKSEPLDMITLTDALRSRGWYEQVGGSAMITSLFEDSFAIGNAGHYARIIRDKALVRRMIEAAGEITSDAFEGVENIEAFLDEAERKVFGVKDTKNSKSFSSIAEVLVENMHMIESLSSRNEAVTGLPTGFHDFDKLTAGLHPGQLIIVAGRPAMGKTSLVLSAAQNAAVGAKKACVMIFSLEMSKEELGFRLLSGIARVDSKRLKIGRLTDREWPNLAAAADLLQKSSIFIDDSGDLTVMDMRARCRRLMSQQKRLDLIVVDYLQLMKGSRAAAKDGSREREISEISRNLKGLAKELKVPIIALSQLNRGVESRQDKRPMMSDLRESGAIEQDADMICFVYRDEVYNKETEDKGIAEFIVAKHRGGETATVRLAWLGEFTLFANLAPDSPGTPISGPRPDRGDVGL